MKREKHVDACLPLYVWAYFLFFVIEVNELSPLECVIFFLYFGYRGAAMMNILSYDSE